MKLENKNLLQHQGFIDGKWINSTDNQTFDVHNPANMDLVKSVANMSKIEADQAIDVAENSFKLWQLSTGKERYALLMNWYKLLLENQKDLATIMVTEQGKPLAEAMGEVAYSASFVQWFAEQAKRINGVVKGSFSVNADLQYTKEPVGVVGVITPWNFPLAMITRKVAPALAAGCTVVIKPPALTPLSALAATYLADKAGIPKGVINIVPSNKSSEMGKALTLSKKVSKISFTGSTGVGKILLRDCSETIKRTSMELGGNAPFIIFDDADLDIAITSLMISKFRNAGQTCVCPNRILVQKSIMSEVVKRLEKEVSKLVLGNGLEEGVTMGPLINEKAVAKVENQIKKACEQGATIVTGGKRHSLGATFFEPTIITNVSKESIFGCEESFAPIAPLIPFDTEEEAIEIANDTDYGLAAYFCSQNHKRIRRVNLALKSGMVAINEGVFSNELGPFGGVKQSGLGREGSELGIDEYLDIKYTLTSYK